MSGFNNCMFIDVNVIGEEVYTMFSYVLSSSSTFMIERSAFIGIKKLDNKFREDIILLLNI
jgi:hypothetical protein